MKRRVLIAVLIILGISLTALAKRLYGPLAEARRSCRTFRVFVAHVQRAKWSDARAMLGTDPQWFRIEGGKVLYYDHDITDIMAAAETEFWKTFEYYITDRHMGEKVIFRLSCRGNYAKLADGKIISVKIQ